MIRLVTRGRFTHDYLKALLGAPEEREPAVRKVVEAASGKVISFYFTTGDTDFLLISEANEAESVIASLLAASATGTISNVSTARAWTGAEFKGIVERAAKRRAHTGLRASTDCARQTIKRPSHRDGLPLQAGRLGGVGGMG
jgi:uncharacterized protein with GYD domain